MSTLPKSTMGTVLLTGLFMFAVAPFALAASPTDGYLYGKVTTRSGNVYTGLLRWGSEEAFWDDLFHSSKDELPYLEHRDDRGRQSRGFRIFGRTLRVDWDESGSRVFIARFGDIAKIEVTGGDDAEVTMKSGAVYRVSGYANDVGGEVTVWDAAMGEVELSWRKIDMIEFRPTPSGVKPLGERLFGKLKMRDGELEGFIQWDKQECLTSDKLDGDSEDGRLSLPFGSIRSIERRNRRSSTVVLKDGRTVVLDGTNDVDSDNRGIYVEVRGLGRVLVDWDSFEKLELVEGMGSGRGYDDFTGGAALHGTVTDGNGKSTSGRLVFDLDESESFEMVNGERDGVEYDIPFENVASIVPRGRWASVVTLTSGQELRLEDGQDVSEKNDGVLVFTDGERDPVYVKWDDVERCELAGKGPRMPAELPPGQH